MTYSDYMDRVLDLVENDALKPCAVCSGLPPGLPPQCYDGRTECSCNDEGHQEG